jgi:hypothetical protein
MRIKRIKRKGMIVFMGKKSVKENKNIYFQAREAAQLTRTEASERMPGYSESKIERMENERSTIHPEDIVAMAEAYKRPDLCNYYCAKDCSIGQATVPEIQVNSLPEIVLGLLSTLNAFEARKNRLIDISVDGDISDEELYDYVSIQNELDKMSLSIDALKLWIEKKIASGNINKEKLDSIKAKLSN